MSELIQKLKDRFGVAKLAVGGFVILIVVAVFVEYFAGGMGGDHYRVDLMEAREESMVAPTMSGGGFSGKIVLRGAYDGDMAQNTIVIPSPGPWPGAPASTPVVPIVDRKIIKNGSLDLLVKQAESATRSISAIAARLDGFTDASNVYEVSDGIKAASVTIRVPADNFNKAFDEIKKLAVKVRYENTSAQDVTAIFTDLDAQLKNYRAEEEQYQEIMKRAVKIEDVLNVASRLADVRGRIERLQGELNLLSRQISMSTISVSLTSEAEVEVFGIVWRPLTVLKQAAKNALSDLAGFVDYLIAGIVRLPVFLLKLAVFVGIIFVLWQIVVRLSVRYFERKK